MKILQRSVIITWLMLTASGLSAQQAADPVFKLGGLVYAGEYPLNNPVMTGDTGIASLYRMVNNQIVFVEDHLFQEYGYYWFGYLFPGDYMVKIGLTEGSPGYDKYFTTYYGDEISWTRSSVLTISDEDIFEADLHLHPVQSLPPGQGVIRGYVNFEQGDVFSMPPVSQINVILSDANYKPLIFSRPDASGYFEFSGIPFNTYKLSADATGKPASTMTVALSQASPVVTGINLTVFGGNTSFVPDKDEGAMARVRVYPNPARENLTVQIFSGISGLVDFRISDLSGRTFLDHAEFVMIGTNDIKIATSEIPSGLYLLTTRFKGESIPVVVKFIK